MIKIPHASALLIAVLCATSSADIVTLKSGEKIQGTISSQDASQVTIDVKVSDSISDQRVVKRDDIQNIQTTPPDDVDFEQIKNLKPDPLLADSAATEAAMVRLSAFLAKYPQSAHDGDVKAALDAFKKDQQHMAAGEVKYFGRWISKNEAAGRKTQLDGLAIYGEMRGQAERGDYIGALNAFDQLEKAGSDTRVFPQALALDISVLQALSQVLNHDISMYKIDADQWQRGFIITPDSQKPEIIAAQKAEQDKYDALMTESHASGVKWMPVIPRSGKNLDELLALAKTENDRLSRLPMDKMNASLADVDKARDAIAAQDYATADSNLKEALTLWPQDEDAGYLQKVLAAIKATNDKNAAAAAAAASAAAKATPKPTAKPSVAQTTAAAAPAAPAAPADEDKPSILAFFMTIPGALCVVGGAIALLLIATVLQKMKKPNPGKAE